MFFTFVLNKWSGTFWVNAYFQKANRKECKVSGKKHLIAKKENSYSSDSSGFVLILLNFFHWGLIHKGIWLLKIAVMF